MGIVHELKTRSKIDRSFVNQYVFRLETEYGVKLEYARKVVLIWCMAYLGKCELASDIDETKHLRLIIEKAIAYRKSKKERFFFFNVGGEYVDGFYNNLQDEPVARWLIKSLVIDCNSYSELEKFSNIESINISNNVIRRIPNLMMFPKLKEIMINKRISIDELPLTNLTNIEKLSFSVEDEGKEYDFSSCRKLRELDVFIYAKSDEDAGRQIGRFLFAEDNSLEKVSIRVHDGLRFNYNDIRDLKNVKELLINDETLEDISLIQNMVNLKRLCLVSSSLSDITCLAKIKTLESVRLDYCAIVDITPLQYLPKLEELRIYKNPIIYDFDKSGIKWVYFTKEEHEASFVEGHLENSLLCIARSFVTNNVDLAEIEYEEKIKLKHQELFEKDFDRYKEKELYKLTHYVKYSLDQFPYLFLSDSMRRTMEELKN